MLGYAREELIGKTIADIIPPEDVPRLAAVRAALLVPGQVERAEWRQRRKDGTLIPVEVSANILPGGRWQAFVRDISERRRIEDERQVFVSLLENSSDFIGVADPSGKPIYVNPAGRRMVGLPADYPVEKTQIPDYYPAEERAFASDVILKAMVERGRWSGETLFSTLADRAGDSRLRRALHDPRSRAASACWAWAPSRATSPSESASRRSSGSWPRPGRCWPRRSTTSRRCRPWGS